MKSKPARGSNHHQEEGAAPVAVASTSVVAAAKAAAQLRPPPPAVLTVPYVWMPLLTFVVSRVGTSVAAKSASRK